MIKNIFLLLVFLSSLNCFGQTNEFTSLYYNTLSDTSALKINDMLILLGNKEQTPIIKAYTGALLMKKSEFMNVPAIKIDLFKKGVEILENEIKNDQGNIEYRFLRLVIQENAPKILKYNSSIESDKEIIINGFKRINVSLQKIILNYSLNSVVLKEYEFERGN